MSVFVDTGFFVAFHNTRDANHSRALELIKEIAAGRLGSVYTSDYVFDEAVTVTLLRTRRVETALTRARARADSVPNAIVPEWTLRGPQT